MWRLMWISIFITHGACTYISTVSLICYYNASSNANVVASLSTPETLITSGCLDVNKRTAFYALGFKSKVQSDTTQAIVSGIRAKGDHNVIIVDWSFWAYSPNISTVDDAVFYVTRAAPAAVEIGKLLGKALIRLTTFGLNLLNTVLSAFSLGCHLMGYAGREVQDGGQVVWLIYCVDAAGPLFGSPLYFKELDADCAQHVTCLHADPYFFGTNDTVCTSDIMMNFEHFIDGDNLQPGCPSRLEHRGCSHVRGALVAGEALANPGTVLASGAPTYAAWAAQNGSGTDIIDVGDFDSTASAIDNYFFTTAAAPDYGLGQQGLYPPAS